MDLSNQGRLQGHANANKCNDIGRKGARESPTHEKLTTRFRCYSSFQKIIEAMWTPQGILDQATVNIDPQSIPLAQAVTVGLFPSC